MAPTQVSLEIQNSKLATGPGGETSLRVKIGPSLCWQDVYGMTAGPVCHLNHEDEQVPNYHVHCLPREDMADVYALTDALMRIDHVITVSLELRQTTIGPRLVIVVWLENMMIGNGRSGSTREESHLTRVSKAIRELLPVPVEANLSAKTLAKV